MNPLSEQLCELSRVLGAELLRRGAVKVNTDEPFLLTSGNFSPIYINCRQLISCRASLQLIIAASMFHLESRDVAFDVIAGGETAGIPFAAFLATALNKPMIYVRKAARAHGTGSRLEGLLEPGQRVLLVEDLITDGITKLTFLEAIRDADGVINTSLVVFDRLQGGESALARRDVQLIALTDIESVLRVAEAWAFLPRQTVDSVRAYLESPSEWHAHRGLTFVPPVGA